MSAPLADVTTALKKNQVIPDVIPSSLNFEPSVLFSVLWPSNGTEVVAAGGTIARDLTVDEPELKIVPMQGAGGKLVDEGVSYTVVLTDPDAPSRADPKYGEWRHWVVPGVKLAAAKASETEGILAMKTKASTTPYYPPSPPPGSGLHRYTFLLFEEPEGGITIPGDAVEHSGEFASRRNWNALSFAQKFQLTLVGAIFFSTEVKK